MFQLTEEQVEEIQVLESIYGDDFSRKIIIFDDFIFLNITSLEDKIDPSKYSINLNTSIGTVTLYIKLVENYPMVLPEMDVSSTSHKLVSHDLLKSLKAEVTRNNFKNF